MSYTIPFEQQERTDNSRTCGAACLSMVYRSLGKQVPQAEIWEGISKVNRFGSLASTTHLMVGDALRRGFDAVAVRARHPMFALRCCRDAGIRIILNHRLHQDVPTGHYSVLVDIGEQDVTLHDPYFGPSRRISQGELMQLWEGGANSEIGGHTLIAIAAPLSTPPNCELCDAAIPAAVPCPNCSKAFKLRPITAIGCINQECIVRRWLQVCCPFCDHTWDFTSGAPAPAVSPVPKEEKKDNPVVAEIHRAFAKIDQCCARLAALPLIAGNAEVMKNLEILKGARGKMLEAAAEREEKHRAHLAKLQERVQKSQAKKAASDQKKLEKKKAETNTPAPPLDGNELAHALLKNVGLVKE